VSPGQLVNAENVPFEDTAKELPKEKPAKEQATAGATADRQE